MKQKLTFLGIETSCDETAASVVQAKNDGTGKILSNIVSSQIEEHKEFGGVVPDIAARAHVEKIEFIVKKSIKESNLDINNLDGIAATAGPGLIVCLTVGLNIGKAIAASLKKPFIAVNHLHGHSLAAILHDEDVKFPYLNLLLSGGHSLLVICNENYQFQLLGETLDDSFGEAFDKIAKLLGLTYPGGPEIEKLAKDGNPDSYVMPIPLKKSKKVEFSLSGLKTHIRILVSELFKLDTPISITLEDLPVEDTMRAFFVEPKKFLE